MSTHTNHKTGGQAEAASSTISELTGQQILLRFCQHELYNRWLCWQSLSRICYSYNSQWLCLLVIMFVSDFVCSWLCLFSEHLKLTVVTNLLLISLRSFDNSSVTNMPSFPNHVTNIHQSYLAKASVATQLNPHHLFHRRSYTATRILNVCCAKRPLGWPFLSNHRPQWWIVHCQTRLPEGYVN